MNTAKQYENNKTGRSGLDSDREIGHNDKLDLLFFMEEMDS